MLTWSTKTKSVNLFDVRSGKKLIEYISGDFPWLFCTNDFICIAVQQLVTIWKNSVGIKGATLQQPFFKLKHGFVLVKHIEIESNQNQIHIVNKYFFSCCVNKRLCLECVRIELHS